MQKNIDLSLKGLWVLFILIFTVLLGPSYLEAQEEHPHLPPRPNPPSHESNSDQSKDSVRNAGAWITLYTIPYQPGLWTIVQWSDGVNNWLDSNGWQGSYNQEDHVSWFVEQKDFGKGPFRWVVDDGPGGRLLATSQVFYLPTKADEVIRIEVRLADMWSSYPDSEPAGIPPEQPSWYPPTYRPRYYRYNQPESYGGGQRSRHCSNCHGW